MTTMAGSISLRLGHGVNLDRYLGHIGYHVLPPARGHHFAESALSPALFCPWPAPTITPPCGSPATRTTQLPGGRSNASARSTRTPSRCRRRIRSIRRATGTNAGIVWICNQASASGGDEKVVKLAFSMLAVS